MPNSPSPEVFTEHAVLVDPSTVLLDGFGVFLRPRLSPRFGVLGMRLLIFGSADDPDRAMRFLTMQGGKDAFFSRCGEVHASFQCFLKKHGVDLNDHLDPFHL